MKIYCNFAYEFSKGGQFTILKYSVCFANKGTGIFFTNTVPCFCLSAYTRKYYFIKKIKNKK
ncbi:hypothetical protein HMPREF9554_00795 [Treponema phagedenis F0421]|nr:hypothetical protein HMPREF9554_00795 [Treponema phagedenis F0421]